MGRCKKCKIENKCDCPTSCPICDTKNLVLFCEECPKETVCEKYSNMKAPKTNTL